MVVTIRYFRQRELCAGARTHVQHVFCRIDVNTNLPALDVNAAIDDLQASRRHFQPTCDIRSTCDVRATRRDGEATVAHGHPSGDVGATIFDVHASSSNIDATTVHAQAFVYNSHATNHFHSTRRDLEAAVYDHSSVLHSQTSRNRSTAITNVQAACHDADALPNGYAAVHCRGPSTPQCAILANSERRCPVGTSSAKGILSCDCECPPVVELVQTIEVEINQDSLLQVVLALRLHWFNVHAVDGGEHTARRTSRRRVACCAWHVACTAVSHRGRACLIAERTAHRRDRAILDSLSQSAAGLRTCGRRVRCSSRNIARVAVNQLARLSSSARCRVTRAERALRKTGVWCAWGTSRTVSWKARFVDCVDYCTLRVCTRSLASGAVARNKGWARCTVHSTGLSVELSAGVRCLEDWNAVRPLRCTRIWDFAGCWDVSAWAGRGASRFVAVRDHG